jgi:serine/threonine protein kinase
VYKGLYNNTEVAIKVMKNGPSPKIQAEFEQEIKALAHIRHPNLVLFLGCCIQP